MLALPIFPGRLQPSIVGRSELNFRVRDGNGWTLALISTNFYCNWLSPATNYLLFYIQIARFRLRLCRGDPYRIRTDVKGVRGLCLNHLTNGPYIRKEGIAGAGRASWEIPSLVRLQGLEPGTH